MCTIKLLRAKWDARSSVCEPALVSQTPDKEVLPGLEGKTQSGVTFCGIQSCALWALILCGRTAISAAAVHWLVRLMTTCKRLRLVERTVPVGGNSQGQGKCCTLHDILSSMRLLLMLCQLVSYFSHFFSTRKFDKRENEGLKSEMWRWYENVFKWAGF